MAAAAANKQKRLPRELQAYKREIKALPFKERVKAYFDCSPYLRDIDSKKEDIILSSFSKEEREEYYRVYSPIYNSIQRYEDRIRAINANRMIYDNYIISALRRRDTFNYTADFLNMTLSKVEEALDTAKEESTRETLKEAIKALKSYRKVSIDAPEIRIKEDMGRYEIPTEKEDNFLKGAIDMLRGIITLLKCYLESLKEFMEWVGTPELLPVEFADMEKELRSRYKGLVKDETKNPEADKYPLFFTKSEIEKEYISIDYEALPRTIDIFGENNLFANTYRRFFDF